MTIIFTYILFLDNDTGMIVFEKTGKTVIVVGGARCEECVLGLTG